MAAVRLSSRAPWEQERRIIGMVASPVENHSIVLLKLDKAIQMSDFARSICLAGPAPGSSGGQCVGLGWDSLTGELTMSQLTSADLTECQSETEVSANSVCMTAGTEDNSLTAGDSCSGEMMAGHGLMCEQETGVWQLVGVAAWRRGCGSVGQRPRLYEMVNLTSSWVENVIKMDMEAGNTNKGYQVPRRRLG